MINLTAQLDTAEINRKMREVYSNAKQMTSGVVTESEKMDIAMMRFKNTLISTAAQIGGGVGLFQLAKQIATTRGEFQQLEVAFTTLLQSKSKADALMSEMVTLAAKTPFDLQGVASGARQLLAYGFSADKITDTLTRLGNVAAGLGLPLERLTYLYGTTAVQGRLYARDMLQFTSSGIPVLQEMAKMYGKTTEEINAMVSAGKIGFKDVEKVFVGMTDQGGKFYNLMQEQSKTINGQISNLSDAIDMMFNNIGKSQEGVINSAISGAAYLVENYEKILKILVPLVATYGAYKASLMAVAAVQSAAVGAQYAIEAAELQKLLLAKEANKNADIEAAVAKGRLTEEQSKNILSIRAEVAAHLESLKVSAMQASAEQANAAIALKNARLNAFNAKQAFQQAQINLSLAKLSGDAKQIEAAQESLLSAERNQSTAANLRNSASKELGIAKSKAVAAATVVETAQTNINTAATTAATRAQKLFAGVSVLTTNAVRALKATLASFLPVAIIAAVGMLAYKLYEVATAETEAEKATKRLREANKDFETSVLKETSALNIMFDRLKRAKEGTTEYAEAKKAIQDKYGPLLSSMGQEVKSLNNITGAQKALTAAILDTARARAQERFVQSAADTAAEAQADALEDIKDKLIKEKGEGRGSELFESIKAALHEYNLDPQDREGKKYGEFIKTLRDSGITDGIGYGKEFTSAYYKYVSAVQELKKAEADAQSLFGAPKKKENTADQKTTTISEDLKTATKEYNDALAAWDKGVKDNLETGVVSKLKQEAEDAKKRLEDIKSALGIDPKAAAKAGSDALKSQNEIDDARLKNLLAAQKERIDAMQDGKAKELAQINAERIAKLAAIDKEEQETAAKYAKMEQAVPQGETDTFTVRRNVVAGSVVSQTAEVEKKYAKEIEDLYTQIGSVWLTEEEKKRAEVKKTYDGMREELKALYMGGGMTGGDYLSGLWNIEQAEDQTGTKNLIDDYITYTQQREEIEKKFNDDIAAMQAKNADGSFTKNIEEAERQRDEAIDALNKAIADREGEFSLWADRILNMGLRGLKKALEAASQALESGDGNLSEKERAMLEAKIKALEKQIEVKEKGAGFGKKSTSDWKDTAQIMNNVATSARNIIASFDGMDDGLKNVLTSFVNVAEGAGQMATAIAGIGTAVGAAEKASAILLAISAAVSVISGLFSWIGGDDPIEKTRKEFADLNDEIIRLKRESDINSWEDTIFGEGEWMNASENMKVYVEAFKRYNKTLEDIRNRGQEVYVDFQGANSDWVVTEKANLDKMAKTWETAAESIANMQVQTRHSTWFRSAKYASLGDMLPSLFDGEQLNMDSLKEFQGSDLYNKLTEENRKLIDNLVADWELYGKALDEVKGYLSDIFGDLGSSMTDALVDAFTNGTDAAKAFADSVSDMLESLAKDMIYTVTLAPLFDKAQKDMLDVMGSANLSDEEKFKRYAEILKGVTQDAIAGQDDFNRLLEEYQRIAEESGLDLFKPEDKQQQATSKGFQAMSQDTGNELNGRFTVMSDIMYKSMIVQEHIRETGLNIADATFNIRDLVSVANNHLYAISNNTNELYDIRRELKSIRENTGRL